MNHKSTKLSYLDEKHLMCLLSKLLALLMEDNALFCFGISKHYGLSIITHYSLLLIMLNLYIKYLLTNTSTVNFFKIIATNPFFSSRTKNVSKYLYNKRSSSNNVRVYFTYDTLYIYFKMFCFFPFREFQSSDVMTTKLNREQLLLLFYQNIAVRCE